MEFITRSLVVRNGNHFIRLLICFLVLSTPIFPADEADDHTLSVTYLANEGVLLESKNSRVLIDGLFRDGIQNYLAVPKPLLEELETASGEYGKIDAVLVTHLHPDHYEAASVLRHLQHNLRARLVGGADVIDLLRSEAGGDYEKIAGRVSEIRLSWQQDSTFNTAGIKLTVLRTRHGWHKNYGLDHLGFALEMDGMRVLHLGDLELTEENLGRFDLGRLSTDVAILPYWMLTYDKGIELVRRYIKPKHLLAVHVEPSKVVEVTRDVHATFPHAIIAGKSRQVSHFSRE